MSAALNKALRALLTDPCTGDRLSSGAVLALAWHLMGAVLLVLAIIGGALGLGAGQ